MKTVSVIIPYYRKIKYIKKSIDSVLNQKFKNFEIIIVHDDPRNKDFDYLLELKKNNNKIRLIKNKKNLGAGFSRNKGIKLAKSKYIAFLDSDDTWKKEKLKSQISFMKKNNLDFSFTSYDQIDSEGKKLKTVKAPKLQRYDDLLKDCRIGLSTVILKKKLINKKFKFSNLKTKEDLCLWLKLSKKYKLVGYNKNLSKWRKMKESLSSSTKQKILDGFRLYYKHEKFSITKSIFYLFLLSFNFLKKNYLR